jgi:hypothetical protein
MSRPAKHLLARIACTLALPLLAITTKDAAQTTTLDEGTFRLTSAGRDVGSETFSIQQAGSAASATINARGNVTIDTTGVAEELQSALQVTGASLQPAAYTLRISQGPRQEQITGRVAGGRFIARILSPTGEELREYLVSNRAVLIDQGIVHQYYFLARRMQGDSMRIPILIPRQNRQVTATVVSRGTETITVGNQRIAARHLVVTPSDGAEAELWVDDRARVLQLEIPALRFGARRTAPPR